MGTVAEYRVYWGGRLAGVAFFGVFWSCARVSSPTSSVSKHPSSQSSSFHTLRVTTEGCSAGVSPLAFVFRGRG